MVNNNTNFTDKLKKIAKQVAEFAKKAWVAMKSNPILTACVSLLAVALIICSVLASFQKSEEHPEESEAVYWGIGLTENVPEFESEAVSYDTENEGYAAAYYADAGLQQVEDYISKLETELGISFSGGETFPRTAVCGEKIIVIHYNAAEMKLSVTVAEKTNGSN